MATIPQAVDAYREMHQGAQTFDPTKSAVLSTIAAEEHQEEWNWRNNVYQYDINDFLPKIYPKCDENMNIYIVYFPFNVLFLKLSKKVLNAWHFGNI